MSAASCFFTVNGRPCRRLPLSVVAVDEATDSAGVAGVWARRLGACADLFGVAGAVLRGVDGALLVCRPVLVETICNDRSKSFNDAMQSRWKKIRFHVRSGIIST